MKKQKLRKTTMTQYSGRRKNTNTNIAQSCLKWLGLSLVCVPALVFSQETTIWISQSTQISNTWSNSQNWNPASPCTSNNQIALLTQTGGNGLSILDVDTTVIGILLRANDGFVIGAPTTGNQTCLTTQFISLTGGSELDIASDLKFTNSSSEIIFDATTNPVVNILNLSGNMTVTSTGNLTIGGGLVQR